MQMLLRYRHRYHDCVICSDCVVEEEVDSVEVVAFSKMEMVVPSFGVMYGMVTPIGWHAVVRPTRQLLALSQSSSFDVEPIQLPNGTCPIFDS